MKSYDVEVARLAAEQFGIVSRRQLVMLGLTSRMIEYREETGSLLEVFPRAYRLPGTPDSWKGRLLAAQCSLGPDAIVSHRAAAAVYNIEGHSPGYLEFTLRQETRRPLPAVIQHRAISLTKAQVSMMGPFRTTVPERLLLDLAAIEPPRLVEVALDSMLFKRLTTVPRVAAFLSFIRRPGIRGVRNLEGILCSRDPDQAPAESIFETNFFRFLRDSHLPTPTFQHEVYDQDGWVARLDVAYPAQKVGVEAQSLRWHSGRERVKRDAQRQNRLVTAGWRVLYETYDSLNQRPQEIIARLEQLLRG